MPTRPRAWESQATEAQFVRVRHEAAHRAVSPSRQAKGWGSAGDRMGRSGGRVEGQKGGLRHGVPHGYLMGAESPNPKGNNRWSTSLAFWSGWPSGWSRRA